MKYMSLALLLSITMPLSIHGQIEHAPTAEQCRADQRLWHAKLEDNMEDRSRLPKWDVLHRWTEEMHDCEKVDPENLLRYRTTGTEIDAEQLMRVLGFIDRHGLYHKFVEEDASGKR